MSCSLFHSVEIRCYVWNPYKRTRSYEVYIGRSPCGPFAILLILTLAAASTVLLYSRHLKSVMPDCYV